MAENETEEERFLREHLIVVPVGFPTSPAPEIEDEEEDELTGLDLFQEQLDDYDEDAVKAFYDNQGTYWDKNPNEFEDAFREAYAGEYASDEDFAQEMAEEVGAIARKVEWPYTCIDWEQAARELMYDYFEEGGYYFSNI